MTDRTAIDTIKGYFYQFDFTIATLLELGRDDDTIIVEGIEDVDVKTVNENTAVQCKYYSKTEYNHSVIAKPIRLMLEHYKEVKNGAKKKVNYKLYGYFKSGHNKLPLILDSDFFKNNFFTYSKKGIKYFHHTKLHLNDQDLDDFIALLKIDIAALEYESQLSKITKLLMTQFSCNAFEAEHFYYNNSLKLIKDISVEDKIAKRKISKSDFLKKINFKRTLFNEWFVKYKGENKFFADLRSQYFTGLNVSPFERFFIIEVPSVNYLRSELKELLLTISKKWSRFSKRDPSPFCSYVYLHNIPLLELLELKKELYSEGFVFIDGFDFDGSDFNPKSISKPIKDTPIKLKILNKLEYIDLTIKQISKAKEIYQFYSTSIFYTSTPTNIKQVKIQFSKLTDIKKII